MHWLGVCRIALDSVNTHHAESNMKLGKPAFYYMGMILAASSLFTACNPRTSVPAHLRDLSYDPNARNIALLFGAANGLPGIQDDLNHMKQVLEDPQGGNGFQVVMLTDASRDQILSATQEAAVAAGENGTIFWYFSGHGAESGDLMTTGGMLPFSKVTDTIRSARQTPVKRMFAMFDSCFSGQMVNGSAAINGMRSGGLAGSDNVYALTSAPEGSDWSSASDDEAMMQVAKNYANIAADSFYDQAPVAKMAPQAFEQLIVMSASQRYETSLAGSGGSEFTSALANVFQSFKSGRPQATIGEFLDAVRSETARSSGGHHTPAFRVMPEQEIMADTLFAKPRQQNLQPGPQPAPGATPGVGPAPAPALGMVIAIGPGDATTGAARLYAGTDASVTRVGLCSGRKEACLRRAQVFLEFRPAAAQTALPQIPAGGVAYESARPIVIEASKPVTFLGFDASGKVVVSRTIQFRRN